MDQYPYEIRKLLRACELIDTYNEQKLKQEIGTDGS